MTMYPIKRALGGGGILHLWGASERRLRAKHAWYKVTERRRWPNKPVAVIERMYNAWNDPSVHPHFAQVWEFAEAPANWWAGAEELVRRYLRLEGVPWQEHAVREMVEAAPAEFAGLDLFGLMPAGGDHSDKSAVSPPRVTP